MTADEARKLREKHLAKQTIEPFVAQLHDRIAAAAAKGASESGLSWKQALSAGTEAGRENQEALDGVAAHADQGVEVSHIHPQCHPERM